MHDQGDIDIIAAIRRRCGLLGDKRAVGPRLMRRDLAIAVGRFVRLPDEPKTAELAITVVDGYQRKGLGTIVLRRLAEAKAEYSHTSNGITAVTLSAPFESSLGRHSQAL